MFRFDEVDMPVRQGLNLRDGTHDLERLIACLTERGWTVYILRGTHVTDRASFFDAVRAVLPLDPPLLGNRSWDALSDSIWGGLDALDSDRIAIIWENAASLQDASHTDYETALEIFMELSASLADEQATDGKPKEIAVVIQETTLGTESEKR